MPSYTTNPQNFNQIRRQLIKRSLLVSLLSLGWIIGLKAWEIWQTGNGDLSSLFFIIPVFIGIIVFTLRNVIKQQREIWNSIQIKLNQDQVSYQQLHISEVTIERAEVISIHESRQGLCIQSRDKTRSILIPINLERADYLEIKTILSNWTEIKSTSSANNLKQVVIVIIYILGFIVIFISPFIWLSAIIGIAIIAFNLYANRLIQRNKAVDPQYKKVSKRVLFMVIFIIAVNIFGKLYLFHVLPKYLDKHPQQEATSSALISYYFGHSSDLQ